MTENLTLNKNDCLPLRDVVFETLREAILKDVLKPGERLMELQLAAQLDVSRTPIREAIRMLEEEGLAVVSPRKGAVVARMTEKSMIDVLEIREALDELAARAACARMTVEQLDELKVKRDAFVQSIQSGNVREITEADVAFHDVIYQSTGNSRLVSILNNLREQIYRYRLEYLKDERNYPCLIQEHEEIVEALAIHDGKKLIKIMRLHIANQAKAVKQVIRKQR